MSRFARRLARALALTALSGATACGTTVSTSAVQQAEPVSGDAGLAAPTPVRSPSGASVPVMGGGAGPIDAGPAPTHPTLGASVASGAPVPASVSPTTGPLKVGILYAVNDAAAPAGINNGNTFTPDRVVHALVASFNKSGGFGGRQIEPVYAALHSYNDDYEQQIAAACATFTQDNHVAVVLTNAGYYSEQLLSCLSKASVPLISGDYAGADRQDAARYPGFLAPTTLIGEDREASVVEHLAAAGCSLTRIASASSSRTARSTTASIRTGWRRHLREPAYLSPRRSRRSASSRFKTSAPRRRRCPTRSCSFGRGTSTG